MEGLAALVRRRLVKGGPLLVAVGKPDPKDVTGLPVEATTPVEEPLGLNGVVALPTSPAAILATMDAVIGPAVEVATVRRADVPKVLVHPSVVAEVTANGPIELAADALLMQATRAVVAIRPATMEATGDAYHRPRQVVPRRGAPLVRPREVTPNTLGPSGPHPVTGHVPTLEAIEPTGQVKARLALHHPVRALRASALEGSLPQRPMIVAEVLGALANVASKVRPFVTATSPILALVVDVELLRPFDGILGVEPAPTEVARLARTPTILQVASIQPPPSGEGPVPNVAPRRPEEAREAKRPSDAPIEAETSEDARPSAVPRGAPATYVVLAVAVEALPAVPRMAGNAGEATKPRVGQLASPLGPSRGA